MQTRLAILLLMWAAFTVSDTAAFAQQQGDTGVTMGYPASIGIVHHFSDRFAVRPEISFSRGETEIEQVFGETESSVWSLALGASGLFYVKEWDRVRTYLSPRYSYSRNRSTSDSVIPPNGDPSVTTTTIHLVVGSFGAQYSPSDRLSVYGEVGIGFSTQRVRSNLTSTRADAWTVSSRSGVGIIFYF